MCGMKQEVYQFFQSAQKHIFFHIFFSEKTIISLFLLIWCYNLNVSWRSRAKFVSPLIETHEAAPFRNRHRLKSAQQAPIIFNKSLLNVYNRFCYTNCLKCFPHFHMLTHSLKISPNPSLVAGLFFFSSFSSSSKRREIRTRQRGRTKRFKQTLKRLKRSKITFRSSSRLPGNSRPALFVFPLKGKAVCLLCTRRLVFMQLSFFYV